MPSISIGSKEETIQENTWSQTADERQSSETNIALIMTKNKDGKTVNEPSYPVWIIPILLIATAVAMCGGLHCHLSTRRSDRRLDQLHSLALAAQGLPSPPQLHLVVYALSST